MARIWSLLKNIRVDCQAPAFVWLVLWLTIHVPITKLEVRKIGSLVCVYYVHTSGTNRPCAFKTPGLEKPLREKRLAPIMVVSNHFDHCTLFGAPSDARMAEEQQTRQRRVVSDSEHDVEHLNTSCCLDCTEQPILGSLVIVDS